MLSSILNQAGIMSKVYASEPHRVLLRPQELDIYYEPIPTEPADPEKPYPAFLYDQVRAGRQRVTGVFSGLLTTHEKVSETYHNTTGKIYSTYTRTLEDPYFLLKPGAIVIATAGGALMAGKGRKPIQRSLYSLLFGITASSVCYPERAVDIATTGYYHTKSSISQLFSSFGRTTTDRVVEELKEKEADVNGDVAVEPEGDIETSVKEDSIETSKAEEVVDTAEPTTEVLEEMKEPTGEESTVVDSVVVDEPSSSEEPVAPLEAAATPTEEPASPVEEPTPSKEEPASPTEEPAVTKEESTAATEEPVAPTEETATLTEEPATPTEEPATPTEEPTVSVKEEVSTTEAPSEPAPEPYDPQQTELKEILESPFSNPSEDNSKDVTREMEFETTKDIVGVVETESDLGQSNPEDADMYSTRS